MAGATRSGRHDAKSELSIVFLAREFFFLIPVQVKKASPAAPYVANIGSYLAYSKDVSFKQI